MRGKKYYIALDDSERRVVVNCLNENAEQPYCQRQVHRCGGRGSAENH